MRVHIITRAATKNTRILSRLALGLANATGWTVGDGPDPTADLNYFLPYLELFSLPDPNYTATKTAAWFTHHDTIQPGKSDLWARAAEAVDLRLTSARRYLPDLKSYGPAGVVTPPLDRDKFKPDPSYIPADMPVVGVSGWTYPGGRKGEALIAELVQSDLGKRIHMVATGEGWPLRCQNIPWEKLQVFYQNLDIYLCPALVEGVPYPPLEALSCGKKVVLPHDVGLLDDLPHIPGIVRYKAGDFRDMSQAIERAIEQKCDPEALRGAVANYTADAWRDDHLIAFEKLLCPPRLNPDLPDWKDRAGVYYVAFGPPSREVAEVAIRSFKKFMPDVPVCLVSDRPLDAGEDIFIEQPDKDIGGRIAKIRIDELAPAEWQYILYLDADTEITADISFLFQVLADGWEFTICKNPAKYHVISLMGRPDNQEETAATFAELGTDMALQLNGGIFAYRRNENTARFFKLWLEEWNRWGGRDQAALHRALWRQPLQTYALGSEWNTVTRYYEAEMSAGVVHRPMTARRWSGRIDGRLDSAEAWRAVERAKAVAR